MPMRPRLLHVDDRAPESASLVPEGDGNERDPFRIETEFDDVRLILRRWQSMRPAAGGLPQYEEIALGSIGRFADELAVVRRLEGGQPTILRAGPRFETIVGTTCIGRTTTSLPAVHAIAISEALEAGSEAASPAMVLSRALVDGMVSTVETVALPLACRWAGDYFLLFLRPRRSQLNLARLLINATHEGIIALSAIERNGAVRDFSILSINDAAAQHLGSRAEQLQFTLLSEALARPGLSLAHFREAAQSRRTTTFELEYGIDDRRVSLQVGVAVADDILAVTLTDIGELKARETLFRSLFDENPVPMYVRDASGENFLNVNEAALRLYGFDREAFFARGLAGLRMDAEVTRQPSGEASCRHVAADGRVLDVVEYTRDIVVDDAPATLSTIVDVTERKRAEEHVTYLALHDPLTGVANRTLFTRELERAAGQGNPFAVLLIDLDDFKVVNDTLGHAAGDALLIEVTTRLQKILRRSDIVARLGGDEFAVLLPGAASRPVIDRLASRLIGDIAKIRNIDGVEVSVTASVGAALSPNDASGTENLLKCADLALYRAKNSSKGQLRFFEPEMDSQVRERRALEMELRGADIEKEFELHFQPIFGVQSGQLRGFEALLRWNSPKRGMISPAAFIPLAEETGMIHELGRWVVAEACRQAASWPERLVVAVNVSPVQFRRGDLVANIGEALARSRLTPTRLEIEVTESVLLADSEANLAILRRIRDLGARIALDDFGTGYSSMSYLRRFPFSRLKIDRSFIREIGGSPESLAIVRAIIGLGTSLGIDTTAEGVETMEQLNALRQENCGELQGFLFSPPVASAKVSDIIDAFFEPPSQVA
ncbi:diguanylate cyclase (GGDEF)-like protein/PAS domain S-box-containing protein [Mesorhizobium soli]|uniref:putative bifunctional diguanylate cyclase/phosphodiesterase n=1 Tax=Pseudaminobacter soli (ex Li et al. 2025) TaxID=1295366 RepID=UPI0024746C9F|nr:EAL domain-containing protein [Mesorhizobium soli]MDH6231400.1 diguanylate cyclase (GGDEF)-like protein/PAS domain S-box-containing protein [Mesorhizobium soli]